MSEAKKISLRQTQLCAFCATTSVPSVIKNERSEGICKPKKLAKKTPYSQFDKLNDHSATTSVLSVLNYARSEEDLSSTSLVIAVQKKRAALFRTALSK